MYVGRPTIFGNPYKAGRDGMRDGVIKKYKRWFYRQVKESQGFRDELERIKDAEAISCWCAPLPCHADVIVEYFRENG